MKRGWLGDIGVFAEAVAETTPCNYLLLVGFSEQPLSMSLRNLLSAPSTLSRL